MCVCACVCVHCMNRGVWVWDIMAGQRGLRETEEVGTQRHSLAFIIETSPRGSVREGERQGGKEKSEDR